MIDIVGLDPAVGSFGVALPDGTCRTIQPRAGADDNARRLNEIVMRLDTYLEHYKPDVVVIEEPIPPRFATAALRLGELRGAVLIRLFERGLPYVQVHVGKLKKYATGNGNATKDMMEDAARAAGAVVANHDESDAWWLWALGRHAYQPTAGEPAYQAVELREVRNKIRAGIVWPKIDGRVTHAG